MRNEPSDIELLSAARTTLIGLLDHLSGPARSEVAFVVRTLDCVIGRLGAGAGWVDEGADAAARLCGDSATGLQGLAEAIRAGTFEQDVEAQAWVRELLERLTAEKLAEDNPNYPR